MKRAHELTRGDTRAVRCVPCGEFVDARFDVVPGAAPAARRRVWRCPGCASYVGMYSDGRALGPIVSAPVRAMRRKVHAVLDLAWRDEDPEVARAARSICYVRMSDALNVDEFHAGHLLTVESAEVALAAAMGVAADIVAVRRQASDLLSSGRVDDPDQFAGVDPWGNPL